MKILITSNDKGECVSCMTASSSKYYTCIQDIDFNKVDIVGYDIEKQKVITVSKSTPSYRKKEIYDDLKKKNEAYTNKIELEQVKKANEELNGEIKEELQKLKNANVEIVDYINIITSEK